MKTIEIKLKEDIKKNIKKFFNAPIETQNFLFYKRYISHFTENILIKDQESIKYISKYNEVKKGLNHYYVKCNSKTGFTLSLKGNTNSRLKIWSNSNNKYLNVNLIKDAIKNFPNYFNSNYDFLNMLSNSSLHSELCTQGALSRILCNKIKNLDDLYDYYFIYGLKGYGLNKTNYNVKAFKELVEITESLHFSKNLLNSTINPNEFFQNDWKSFVKSSDFKTFVYQHLFDQLRALSKKVNWHSVDLENINNVVQEEINKNNDLLKFYDAGFVLESEENLVIPF